MRLRYLHVRNYPPIVDSHVTFASGSPLSRECAIRFVVGLNGSGKSNLLRAIAEVFLALADLRVPPFPVIICYELGIRGTANHRTLLLNAPGLRSNASLWVAEGFVFEDDMRQDDFIELAEELQTTGNLIDRGFRALIAPGDWPLRDTNPPLLALPATVLAYTTGDLRPWHSVWSRNQDANHLQEEGDDDGDGERPAGWTEVEELALELSRAEGQRTIRRSNDVGLLPSGSFRRPILLDATTLKCALLAVVLPQSLKPLSEKQTPTPNIKESNALQNLLERGGWHELICVGFRSRFHPSVWGKNLSRTAFDWWTCAGEVVAEPHPTELRRTVLFDLKGSLRAEDIPARNRSDLLATCSTQGEALIALLGGAEETPFALFIRLLSLKNSGLFDEVLLRLRRQERPVEQEDEEDPDVGVLRFEELSDGEQMVLTRMALFHLLKGEADALLLLDEPETHFNDRWKREIVDIIDDAIGQTPNDVLISTHSAIVLSDVFSDEIVMVQKTPRGSDFREVTAPTFATDPGALMLTVFDADDSIGKRAQEFLEKKLREGTGKPEEIKDLQNLINKMGSGFYRSELRTLLNTWQR